jgi:hypothetical protein
MIFFKSIKKRIVDSFFYSVLVLFFILATSLFFIIAIVELINNKNKILTYKNIHIRGNKIHNTIKNNNGSGDIVNCFGDFYLHDSNKKYYNISNTISHVDAEKLFLLHFDTNTIAKQSTKKTVNIIEKKNEKTARGIKKRLGKQENQIVKKKEIIKKLNLPIERKKNKIVEKVNSVAPSPISKDIVKKNNVKTIKKEMITDNKIKSKTQTIIQSPIVIDSLKKPLAFSSADSNQKFIHTIDELTGKNNYEASFLDTHLENHQEIEENNSIELLGDEEIADQNELADYIIRLKKNIKQFPGKKVSLDITILLENASIKDIIFPNILFSLAYKMYIINILKKIEIPKKLWNKTLRISL